MKFSATKLEFDLIVKIAKRVERDLDGYPDDRMTVIMDISACHANGCELALQVLLDASLGTFAHDIYGIRKAINRLTGELSEDIFTPRCVYRSAEVA